jgi:hypothetical protein
MKKIRIQNRRVSIRLSSKWLNEIRQAAAELDEQVSEFIRKAAIERLQQRKTNG